MIIYSWNMLYRNKKLDEAFAFISHTNFDVFCLQEVPEAFLARLKELPFHLMYRTDTEKIVAGKTIPMFNVILSKHPLSKQHDISFDEYWSFLPFRTRAFVTAMPDKLFSKIKNRGGLCAHVTIDGVSYQVFCLHLILAQPAWRIAEFSRAMTLRDPHTPAIVCGDFNILEMPHITPLNWILGGRMSDALFYHRERANFEKIFSTYHLGNAFRGQKTHGLSRSQLDHILVSDSLRIKNTGVSKQKFGSDHHPIRTEIE